MAKSAMDKVDKKKAAVNGKGGGGKAEPSEPGAGKPVDKLDVVKKAHMGLINEKDAEDAATGIIGGTPSGEPLHAPVTPMPVKPSGVDVSHHNGVINWKSVAADGIDFAFIKATDGMKKANGTFWTDPKFTDNWQGASDHALVRGAYHFFRAGEDAEDQAQHFIDTVGDLKAGDLPPALDVEWDSMKTPTTSMSAADLVAGLQKWCDKIEQHYGLCPMIYTARKFWRSFTNDSATFSDHTLWLAELGSPLDDPTMFGGWPSWDFRQYSWTGGVDGISGAVDLDTFNGTKEGLWRMSWRRRRRGRVRGVWCGRDSAARRG